MNVLIVTNGTDTNYPLTFDVSTDKKLKTAYQVLFNMISEKSWVKPLLNEEDETLYDKANGGDYEALQRVFEIHSRYSDYAYTIVPAHDPYEYI
jgi:hypothetical protein